MAKAQKSTPTKATITKSTVYSEQTKVRSKKATAVQLPISNHLYYGDNLEVLRKYIKDETIDLCYIDPP